MKIDYSKPEIGANPFLMPHLYGMGIATLLMNPMNYRPWWVPATPKKSQAVQTTEARGTVTYLPKSN
jgi:hypothetical protein